MTDDEFADDAYIQEGTSPALGVVLACSTVGDDDENPRTRVGVRRSNGWLTFGVSGFGALSLDASTSGAAYVLAESGAVVSFDWTRTDLAELKASRTLTENPAVEDEGPLRRLRLLGADVVAAGSVGQAYLLRDGSFVALPRLLINGEAPTIEDLAGASVSNFVAVTSDGYVAHFDGQAWSALDFPSNASLTSICITRPGQYAISGKTGLIVVGTLNAWAQVPNLDPEVDYWGIAAHDQRIYAASLDGVDEITPQGPSPIPIPNVDALDFTVLRAGPDGVWSFADRTIGRVAKGQWTLIMS